GVVIFVARFCATLRAGTGGSAKICPELTFCPWPTIVVIASASPVAAVKPTNVVRRLFMTVPFSDTGPAKAGHYIRLFHESERETDQFGTIHALAGPEFLRPPAKAVRRIEVALLVDRELMHLPEGAWLCAVDAPPVQQLAVRVVLQDARVGAVRHPDLLL